MNWTNWKSTVAIVLAMLLLTGSAIVQASTLLIGLNFRGSEYVSGSSLSPPDTMGAVGPNHVVELINSNYNVFDKSNGNPLLVASHVDFWNAAGGGFNGSYPFDPRVVYDQSSQRFFAAAVDAGSIATGQNFLVAVSNSSNPLDGWTSFKIDSDTNDLRWADYPRLGVNGDLVTVAGNMFGSTSTEVAVLTIPKADLLAPTPTIANHTLLENVIGTTDFSPYPVLDLDGGSMPASMLMTPWNDGSNFVRRLDLTGSPASPSMSVIADVPVSALNIPPDGDQPGSYQALDNMDMRLSSTPVLQDGVFWGVQGCEDPVSGNSALRWFKILAATNTLLEEGIISDAELDLLYPSIAVNQFGDAVIGFTGTSENQYPSTYAAVGETNDAGSTNFGGLVLLKQGDGNWEKLDSRNRNRWGDYSATVVDPRNPKKFWTFQEFGYGGSGYTEGRWATQVTELTVVPEPISLVILAMGALFVLIWRRRRA